MASSSMVGRLDRDFPIKNPLSPFRKSQDRAKRRHPEGRGMKREGEKRTFGRLKMRARCEIEYERGSFLGMVLDISPRGVFVRMSPGSAPPLGTEARVHLKDTPAGNLTLLARVTRAR